MFTVTLLWCRTQVGQCLICRFYSISCEHIFFLKLLVIAGVATVLLIGGLYVLLSHTELGRIHSCDGGESSWRRIGVLIPEN